MHPKPIVISVCLCTVSGCTITYDFKDTPKRSQNASPVYFADPLPVAISTELSQLEERLTWIDTGIYKVGNLLQRLFVSVETAPVQLELVDSTLSVSAVETVFLTRWDAAYSLALSFTDHSHRKSLISTIGSGSSRGGPTIAGRTAVESAVYSAYKQVKFLMENSAASE